MVALSAGPVSVLDKVFIPLTTFGHSTQRLGTNNGLIGLTIGLGLTLYRVYHRYRRPI